MGFAQPEGLSQSSLGFAQPDGIPILLHHQCGTININVAIPTFHIDGSVINVNINAINVNISMGVPPSRWLPRKRKGH